MSDQPFIGVITPTFRRPALLGHLIWCFENQSYTNAKLIAYDDMGEMTPAKGARWEVISVNTRHATLGEKRNTIAEMLPSCDAFCFWDDDEFYGRDALKQHAIGLSKAPWIRPSEVALVHRQSCLERHKTYWLPDRSDKAYQCSWCIASSVFWAVGGFQNVSLGEDMLLAKSLLAIKTNEYDPCEHGFMPQHIASPYANEHFSWKHKDYATWPTTLKFSAKEMAIEPPPFVPSLWDRDYSHSVSDRSWKGNWFDAEVR